MGYWQKSNRFHLGKISQHPLQGWNTLLYFLLIIHLFASQTLLERPRGNLGIEEALRIDDVAALNALCSYIKKQALVDDSISPRQGNHFPRYMCWCSVPWRSTNPRAVSDVRELVASIQIKLIGEAKPHRDARPRISVNTKVDATWIYTGLYGDFYQEHYAYLYPLRSNRQPSDDGRMGRAPNRG